MLNFACYENIFYSLAVIYIPFIYIITHLYTSVNKIAPFTNKTLKEVEEKWAQYQQTKQQY